MTHVAVCTVSRSVFGFRFLDSRSTEKIGAHPHSSPLHLPQSSVAFSSNGCCSHGGPRHFGGYEATSRMQRLTLSSLFHLAIPVPLIALCSASVIMIDLSSMTRRRNLWAAPSIGAETARLGNEALPATPRALSLANESGGMHGHPPRSPIFVLKHCQHR